MSDRRSLLIELGTEELPPKALDDLARAFAEGICTGLEQHGIAADHAHAHTYCSPRRLAVHVPAVAALQPDQAIERRGPAVQAGLDAEGQPTRALQGFAGSCGVDVEKLERVETDKGAWFVYRSVQQGRSTADMLPEIVAETLKKLPIPRPMRWGANTFTFVRPTHWLLALHGDQVVDLEIMGLRSGRITHGHRFHHPQPIKVDDADQWLGALRDAKVLADPAERRARIREDVAQAASGMDAAPRLSDVLLDEIANLTEWPVAIACAFEREFLDVPPEALVTTMESNQKFVPVYDAEGMLVEHFVGVANIDSTEPQTIRLGYERVIRPRFADARFFYQEDLKTPLESYQEALKQVTYQQSLGSVWDKCVRVAELARVTANRVGVDAGMATRAAALCKCDLMSRMVGEFPELQGVMGRYYALAHGESAQVAHALDAFYQPRHAADAIAASPLARVLAVAERLDTLAGIFAVGMKPSGNKDPFALRRAALGLARTLIEGELDIDLGAAFTEALQLLPEAALAAALKPAKDGTPAALDAGVRRGELQRELTRFVFERLRGYYADQGFSNDQFDAVMVVAPSSLVDFDRRLRAVAAFASRPEAANLAAANKRVGNILRKQAEAGEAPAQKVDPDRFEQDAERELAQALAQASQASREAVADGDYALALTRLAALQKPVDRFFEDVLVMSEDDAVRANRLALLAQLQRHFMDVADIARL